MLKKERANADTSKSYVLAPNPYQANSESVIGYLNRKVETLETKVEGLCNEERPIRASPLRKTQMQGGRPKSFSRPVYK
jgi:hypothetical protein